MLRHMWRSCVPIRTYCKAKDMDVEEFRYRAKEMVDYICTYYKTIRCKKVAPDIQYGYLRKLLPETPPRKPEPWDKIAEDMDKLFMPGVLHWVHPKFHAYFPSGASFPSILAEMFLSVPGAVCFSWASSPAFTELEMLMADWFAKEIGLPDHFLTTSPTGGGVLQVSASDAIFTSMVAARHQAIQAFNQNCDDKIGNTLLPKLVAYCSKEAHSSVVKAAKINLVNIRLLEVDTTNKIDAGILEKAMEKDKAQGLIPFFVSTTLGTTSSCAFDDLCEVGLVCKRFPCVWLHVDAAYAGGAFICPEFKYLMAGIENADSFNLNPAKMINLHIDTSLHWLKNTTMLTQALHVDPYYLKESELNIYDDRKLPSYRHWTIQLSRRGRAVKMWFVLRAYGIEGIQALIRNQFRLAKKFETLVKKDERFEVVNEVKMGLVCFKLCGNDNEKTKQLYNFMSNTREIAVTPTVINDRYVIRFCVSSPHTTDDDIDEAWSLIQDCGTRVLKGERAEIKMPPLYIY